MNSIETFATTAADVIVPLEVPLPVIPSSCADAVTAAGEILAQIARVRAIQHHACVAEWVRGIDHGIGFQPAVRTPLGGGEGLSGMSAQQLIALSGPSL